MSFAIPWIRRSKRGSQLQRDLQAIGTAGAAVAGSAVGIVKTLVSAVLAAALVSLFVGFIFGPDYAAIAGICLGIVHFLWSGALGAASYLNIASLCLRSAGFWTLVSLAAGLANHYGLVAAIGAGLLTFWVAKGYLLPEEAPRQVPSAGTLRGSEDLLTKREDVLKKAAATRQKYPDDPVITWGGLELPASIGTTHMLVMGTTGSGKTVTINLLLKSILPHIGTGRDWRLCIFDPQTEVISQLHALGMRCPHYVLNVFDRRCHAWHMAKDLTAPQDISAAADLLFPLPENKEHTFWDRASGALAEGVMISFHERLGEDWTFRDLLLALSSSKHLREILSWSQQNDARIEGYLDGNAKTINDVMMTVANYVNRYKVIASYWHHAHEAKRQISLEDWATSESVLILGNSHKAPEITQELNRILFRRLSQVVLNRGESKTRRTWFCLDELSEAGKLHGLPKFLQMGRSHGICAVLGFQDGASLERVYAEQMAKEITGQANCKAILRLQERDAAEWAQKVFGDAEKRSYRASEGTSMSPQGGGSSTGIMEQKEVDALVMASQFQAIPHAMTPGIKGLGGFYNTATVGAYGWEIPFELIQRELPQPQGDETEANFQPAPDALGWLQNWNDDELRRLGLPPRSDRTKPAPRPSPPTNRSVLDGLDIE